ncbi:VOC family protein [bacterium SCSIO 12741]|nr:VOC family protein [bacterium SCSIO 12741]
MSVSFKPEGYPTISPFLSLEDIEGFIEFVQFVFGGEVTEKILDGEGNILHAELTMGNSTLMMGPARGNPTKDIMLYTYTEDTDAAYQKILDRGGVSIMPPGDQFYGDRNAGVKGPFGINWWIATRVEIVDSEEMQRRSLEMKG